MTDADAKDIIRRLERSRLCSHDEFDIAWNGAIGAAVKIIESYFEDQKIKTDCDAADLKTYINRNISSRESKGGNHASKNQQA